MKLASQFRESARKALKGRWGYAVLAGFLATLFGALNIGAPSGGISFNINIGGQPETPPPSTSGGTISMEMLSIILLALGVFLLIVMIVSIAVFILGSIISLGYAKYNLDLIDGRPAAVGTMFKYFPHWKRAISTNLLKTLLIFVWSLLFIIPGIVAAYSYAMVPYILAENPTISATDALYRSKRMMRGNRFRLFCLSFSFIGWMFLSAFTLTIGNLWLTPYMQASFADFYREVSGTRVQADIVIESADAPHA